MRFLKIYLFLAIAMTPAFAAAVSDAENRAVLLALVAVLAGYATAVCFGSAFLNKRRGSGSIGMA